jgi:DNA polymerase III subunit epsilon
MDPRRYVICDIEATGLDEHKELIEIALITWQEDRVIDVFETLINPLRPVPPFILNLTSISARELIEAPKFYDVAEAIKVRLEGATFVSHNTDFDLELLKKKYFEMGQELRVKRQCTLKIAQKQIPGLKNYNLDALCSFFGIKIKERHRAIGDAKATLELFLELQSLRMNVRPKMMWLPHHEKILKDLPAKAGLLIFKDNEGKASKRISTFNMQQTARELLLVSPKNRELLTKSESIDYEVTGSALIADFKKLLYEPQIFHWMVVADNSEFQVRPYKKGTKGLWYFRELISAKKKVRELNHELREKRYAYREGGISKEEVLERQRKMEKLSREEKFPSDHILLVGEGRYLAEKSFVLIRNQHVLGYGYAEVSDKELQADPERYLIRRYQSHIGADLAAIKYLKVLKNVKAKTENWRSLSEQL